MSKARKYERVGDSITANGKEVGWWIDGEVKFADDVRSPAVRRKVRRMLMDWETEDVKEPIKAPVPTLEKVPPCPKGNAKFGDKDPCVMDWYKKHKPAEYKIRYAEFLKKLAYRDSLDK